MKIKIELQEFDLNSEEIHMIKRIYRFFVSPNSTWLTISDKKVIEALKHKGLLEEGRLFIETTSMGNKVYKKLVGKK